MRESDLHWSEEMQMKMALCEPWRRREQIRGGGPEADEANGVVMSCSWGGGKCVESWWRDDELTPSTEKATIVKSSYCSNIYSFSFLWKTWRKHKLLNGLGHWKWLVAPPFERNRRNEGSKSFNVTIYSILLDFKTRKIKRDVIKP